MLHWANQFNIFCYLDNNGYNLPPHNWECLLAVDAVHSIDGTHSTIQHVDAFVNDGQWVFGHISYEAMHGLYELPTNKISPILFPSFFFFKPRYLLMLNEDFLIIEAAEPDDIFRQIENFELPNGVKAQAPVEIKALLSKEQYIATVNQLLHHIHRGDCYEINFCQLFYAHTIIQPVLTFLQLMQTAPNPFGAFYKWNDQYLICASPERFLTKKGNQLLAQPMKGTAMRVPQKPSEDEASKLQLQASEKDKAENVMVVDLVRNDLSRICSNVVVTELFGIQSFPYVHQMVSTVTGNVHDGVTFSDMIQATFPMGSMTGAPKKRVMQLIEKYERQKRGIFSGSVGYCTPGGDFDFNVVIRSLMYNSSAPYLCYQVGSGITAYSQPLLEWEECELKGAAIKKVLTG